MLYGVDTRAKTTKTVLADKEHYQPWSGQPMSGRILLNWQGRDITIERSTKGRVPLGEFAAYETESGLEIPQLNAGNCGEMLLGAEQSVFERAGFVRLQDLPVTRDDALRRRLNALVTTGDESGDGQQLERELKNLKNQCRYNKTGLLPRIEGELRQIRDALEEFKGLQEQSERLGMQVDALDQQEKALRNHLVCLQNAQADAEAVKLQEARENLEKAEQSLLKLQAVCNELPSPEEAEEKQQKIGELTEKWEQLLQEQQEIPQLLPQPEIPKAFSGLSPRQAAQMVDTDRAAFEKLQVSFFPAWIVGAVTALCAAFLLFVMDLSVPGILLIGMAGGLAALGCIRRSMRKDRIREYTEKYGDPLPKHWDLAAKTYYQTAQTYARQISRIKRERQAFDEKMEKFQRERRTLCGEKTLGEVTEVWRDVARYWESLEQAEKERDQQKKHLQAIQSVVRQVQAPAEKDGVTGNEQETKASLQEIQSRKQELLGRIGQYQGRMEALGTERQLNGKQRELQNRMEKLEQFQEALTIAQNTLAEATAELQRRFAPRITRRAQSLMGRMTAGRYEKLKLSEDFSLHTGTREEDTLHSALWRSEGTMDQLYLSLRLAVSEALTPEAPLILDDALVRFDRERLQKTLEILREEGEQKQIILFTCQEREGKLAPEALLDIN